jgi:hypothetical protein
MKTSILFIFLMNICLLSTMNAQPCYNQISTNPGSPQNSHCPDMENVFDWRIEYIPSNSTIDPPGGTFRSPYYDEINTFLHFLTESIFSTYHDFEPEDGWELIGEFFNPVDPADFACFVMYNRYESFLRIFTTLPQLSSATNYVTPI